MHTNMDQFLKQTKMKSLVYKTEMNFITHHPESKSGQDKGDK